MMLIQIVFLLVVLTVWWRLFLRLRTGELTFRQFVEWFLLWLIIGFVVLVPDSVSYLAAVLGVGRGSDLAIYGAIMLILYLLFKLFARQERQEHQLTQVVRSLALKDSDKPDRTSQSK
jgi:small membrane protein